MHSYLQTMRPAVDEIANEYVFNQMNIAKPVVWYAVSTWVVMIKLSSASRSGYTTRPSFIATSARQRSSGAKYRTKSYGQPTAHPIVDKGVLKYIRVKEAEELLELAVYVTKDPHRPAHVNTHCILPMEA